MKRFISGFIQKYSDKLTLAAKAKGFESVEAMVQASAISKLESIKHPTQPLTDSKKLEIPKSNFPVKSGRLHLDQILNMEKIKSLDSKSISEIWNSHLSTSKKSLSASLSSKTWTEKVLKLRKYPTFLISKPIDESCQFYFMEFSNDSIYVTQLEEYQKYGSHSKPLLELHFYTDLLDKDLVLLKADILNESLNLIDAQYLVYQIQYWYYTGKESTLEIIKKFHTEPQSFDYKWITEYNYFK